MNIFLHIDATYINMELQSVLPLLAFLLLAASLLFAPNGGTLVRKENAVTAGRRPEHVNANLHADGQIALQLKALATDYERNGYGPLCNQGGKPTSKPPPTRGLGRWHVTTQELLIRHLQWLWPDPSIPRTMVDLGSQAGHGMYRNVSDSLLWLDSFHAPGSLVVGVDAFLDFALDLQHRFDSVEPYASMVQVQKIAVHAAIGKPWACELGSATNGSCQLRWNLDLAAAFTHQYCSRTNWQDIFAMLERWNFTDHSCRITRQRAGLSASKLPLPPSPYAFNTHTDGLRGGELPSGAQRYRVPTVTLEQLWRSPEQSPLRGRHIDFLKIDVDSGWVRSQLEVLFFPGPCARFRLCCADSAHSFVPVPCPCPVPLALCLSPHAAPRPVSARAADRGSRLFGARDGDGRI